MVGRATERPWRLVTGMVLAAVFAVGFGVAGMVAVDDALVTVTATDGRAVDLGLRWPGGLDLCVTDASTVDAGGELPNCYREPVDEASAIKQPVSTATTAAFVVIGLAILWSADRRGGEHTWFGFIALFMGPGSALFHGTLTTWGGFFDQLSMYALLAGIIATDLAIAGKARFGPVFWPALAVTGAVKVASGDAATIVFIVLGVGVGVWALFAWRRLPAWAGVRRDGGRLALAFGLLFAAIVPWVLSNPGAGDPTDVPWHGAWHVLSALFVGAYWWYLRSARPVGDDQPSRALRSSSMTPRRAASSASR